MSLRDFWMQVLIHFTAIVLGGLKVALISGVVWYFIRKKYLAKWIGSLMKDLTTQIGGAGVPGAYDPGQPVPGYPVAVASGPVNDVPKWKACESCHGVGMIEVKAIPENPAA